MRKLVLKQEFRKNRIRKWQKCHLYDAVLEESKEQKRFKRLQTYLSNLIEYYYRNEFYPKDIVDLFRDASRIASDGEDSITVSIEARSFGIPTNLKVEVTVNTENLPKIRKRYGAHPLDQTNMSENVKRGIRSALLCWRSLRIMAENPEFELEYGSSRWCFLEKKLGTVVTWGKLFDDNPELFKFFMEKVIEEDIEKYLVEGKTNLSIYRRQSTAKLIGEGE